MIQLFKQLSCIILTLLLCSCGKKVEPESYGIMGRAVIVSHGESWTGNHVVMKSLKNGDLFISRYLSVWGLKDGDTVNVTENGYQLIGSASNTGR